MDLHRPAYDDRKFTLMLDFMDSTTASEAAPAILVVNEGVAWLTLNRPKQYNALSAAMLDAMHGALDQLATDNHARVLVVAANGNAFCAGHDLKEMHAAGDEAFVKQLFSRCAEMMLKIARLPIPVIAEVQGMATAAGCQLVAQCDLAVAADSARFAVSGINLGLFCSTPAVPLSRVISRKRAMEMLMTGEFIDSTTALDWGLVNRVVPAAELRHATQALAETLKSKPRQSLAMGKALFYRQLETGLDAAYQDASATISCNFMQPEAREGVTAFLEKRKPVWN